jgi:hypothetical protein
MIKKGSDFLKNHQVKLFIFSAYLLIFSPDNKSQIQKYSQNEKSKEKLIRKLGSRKNSTE